MYAPQTDRVTIAPQKDAHICRFHRKLDTVHGPVGVSCRDGLLKATIPPNCTATVHWHGKRTEIGCGEYCFK